MFTKKLFPEIKRVDHEDETSKIISNVLGDYQPSLINESSSDLINISKAQMHKIRIQNIFSEFINLTEDFLGTIDDVDDAVDDDDDAMSVSEQYGEPNHNQSNDDEDDDAMSFCEQNGGPNHHQSNEDEDDDASSSSGSNSSSSSSSGSSSSGSSSGSDSEDTNGHIDEEPRSWNLEQFMVQAAAAATAPSAPTPPPILPSSPVPQIKIENPPTDDLMITVDLKKLKRIPRSFQIKKEQQTNNSISSSSSVSNTTIPVSTTNTVNSMHTTQPTLTTNATITLNTAANAPITTTTTTTPTPNTTTTTIGSISNNNIPNTTPTPTPNPPSNPSTTSSSHTTSGHFLTAKTIKHEADAEKDRTKQALKYLKSAMYFILYAREAETVESSSNSPSVPLYGSTVGLIKHVIKLTREQDSPTGQKLHALGCRCLSLLYLRIYKIKSRDSTERDTRIIQNQNLQKTEPDPVNLTVTIKYQVMTAYQRQLAIMENLRLALDFWSKADQVCDKNSAVRIFFGTIDTHIGPLTMSCPFNRMMDYINRALDTLSTH